LPVDPVVTVYYQDESPHGVASEAQPAVCMVKEGVSQSRIKLPSPPTACPFKPFPQKKLILNTMKMNEDWTYIV